jgi:hypothetical protein
MPEKDSGKISAIFRMSGELKHHRQDLLELFDQLVETLDGFDIPEGIEVSRTLGKSYNGYTYELRWRSYRELHVVRITEDRDEPLLGFGEMPLDMLRIAAERLDSLLVGMYDQLKYEDEATEEAIMKLSKIKEWLS